MTLTPNREQVMSAIRWLITTFGTFIAGWFAAKGWFTVDQVLSVLNSETVIGLLASGITLVIGLFVHTKSNAVAVVATMAKDPDSPVKGVVVEPNAAGRELTQASGAADVVVPAGTLQAKALAA